ncbi:MAG TPA: hypothetical protein PLG47_05725 [Candidatus Dojkabacteria bacterium]|nr:hypothetical protein [Candidatus Dojkabacteria bacterium]
MERGENDIKVYLWGIEGDRCFECEYLQINKKEDIWYTCEKSKRTIKFIADNPYPLHELFKECPFKQPLYEEDLEKFGFVYGEVQSAYGGEAGFILKKDTGDIHFYFYTHPFKIVRLVNNHWRGYEILFEGDIDNLVELEWVLKNIGVIE